MLASTSTGYDIHEERGGELRPVGEAADHLLRPGRREATDALARQGVRHCWNTDVLDDGGSVVIDFGAIQNLC